jgi:hypothetical protein
VSFEIERLGGSINRFLAVDDAIIKAPRGAGLCHARI